MKANENYYDYDVNHTIDLQRTFIESIKPLFQQQYEIINRQKFTYITSLEGWRTEIEWNPSDKEVFDQLEELIEITRNSIFKQTKFSESFLEEDVCYEKDRVR